MSFNQVRFVYHNNLTLKYLKMAGTKKVNEKKNGSDEVILQVTVETKDMSPDTVPREATCGSLADKQHAFPLQVETDMQLE